MSYLPGAGIFWSSLVVIVVTMSISTLLGRALGSMTPVMLRGSLKFYVAPVLGLATLTIFASIVGRVVPLGGNVGIPFLLIAALLVAIANEPRPTDALRHTLHVSGFGFVCGTFILAPLFLFGGFNPHNDTFTYLAHAQWLQEHAFSEAISSDRVTPLTTQIFLYQREDLRMGGSFLLALIQSLLHLRWAFEAYPAVIVAAVSSGCLAIGFPLARRLRSTPRSIRYAILSLPAFTLGGLVFGGSMGFMPQTLGLAFGSGVLFASGLILQRVARVRGSWRNVFAHALPLVLLLTAAIYTYSEMAPFLVLSLAGGCLYVAWNRREWTRIAVFSSAAGALTCIFLNTEMIRAFSAIRTQSGLVVGSAVEWSLAGYFAHAVGVHGGAWDIFQWSRRGYGDQFGIYLGIALIGLILFLLLSARREIARFIRSGALMPSALMLILLAAGLFYFRFFARSPFEGGVGQSWSAFKLTEWAHPFAMIFVLVAVIKIATKLKRHGGSAIVFLFSIGIASAVDTSTSRIKPVMESYPGVNNLYVFLTTLRSVAAEACKQPQTIFLALNGSNIKLRQMVVLFLPDWKLVADWHGDDAIFPYLPADQRVSLVTANSCVIELASVTTHVTNGMKVGPLRIGQADPKPHIELERVAGGYGRESDGSNWWYWINQGIRFSLKPTFVPLAATTTKLHFEVAARGPQTLSIVLTANDKRISEVNRTVDGSKLETIDVDLPIQPGQVAQLDITSNGIPTPLGLTDSRVASWSVRNLIVTSTSNRNGQ